MLQVQGEVGLTNYRRSLFTEKKPVAVIEIDDDSDGSDVEEVSCDPSFNVS